LIEDGLVLVYRRRTFARFYSPIPEPPPPKSVGN
jgi:hypothetical protein